MKSRPCEVQASGAIELLFYGELAGDERQATEAHIATCAECRTTLEELRTIRAALATRPVVAAPPGEDWTSLMSRIDFAVAHERTHLPPGGSHESAVTRYRPIPAYLALAALLTLVTASVAYLARHQEARPVDPGTARVEPRPGTEAVVPAADHAVPASPTQADLGFAAVSEQHFERSKLVILGLASRDPQRSSSADWAYERQLAGALLDDTRLYKQAAEARGLESLAGVMSDLELVLLQASLSDQQDTATLDRLQRLIRRRDLVTKMEMARF
jgi:Putative zinc-finger